MDDGSEQTGGAPYIKVKGQWCYLYRAVDKYGQTLDFMLSERRDETAATEFFAQAIRNNGWPDRVVIPFRDIAAQCTTGQWTRAARIMPGSKT